MFTTRKREIIAHCTCRKSKKCPGKKVFAYYDPKTFETTGSKAFHAFLCGITVGFWIPVVLLMVVAQSFSPASSYRCRECKRYVPADAVVASDPGP